MLGEVWMLVQFGTPCQLQVVCCMDGFCNDSRCCDGWAVLLRFQEEAAQVATQSRQRPTCTRYRLLLKRSAYARCLIVFVPTVYVRIRPLRIHSNQERQENVWLVGTTKGSEDARPVPLNPEKGNQNQAR